MANRRDSVAKVRMQWLVVGSEGRTTGMWIVLGGLASCLGVGHLELDQFERV